MNRFALAAVPALVVLAAVSAQAQQRPAGCGQKYRAPTGLRREALHRPVVQRREARI